MYYLDEKQFLPSALLFSVVFVPIIIGLMAIIIVSYNIISLIILLCFLIVYFLINLVVWKVSRKRKHYLLLKEQSIEIVYHDIYKGTTTLELTYDQIIQFEYYRLFTIRWIGLLHSSLVSRCVFMTYRNNSNQVERHIGYMNYHDVKEIAQKLKTRLVVK